MNLGQMLLVVAALTILSMMTLTINTSILQAYAISYDSEATIDAISIGQAMIDEIVTQKFDSLTWTTQKVTTPALFNPTSRLGPDLDSEKTFLAAVKVNPDTAPYLSDLKFNDIDDYNGYVRIAKSTHLGKFTVKDSVYYVQDSNQDLYSTTQTWYKAIQVSVNHPNLYRPVVLKALIVYRRYLPPS